jgi:two-component system phosphate regulon sensor histidine kinase PhoR
MKFKYKIFLFLFSVFCAIFFFSFLLYRTIFLSFAIKQTENELDGFTVFITIAVIELAAGFLVALLISLWADSIMKKIQTGVANLANGNFSGSLILPKAYGLSGIAEEFDRIADKLNKNNIKVSNNKQGELNAIISSMKEGLVAIDTDEKIIIINRAAKDIFRINKDFNCEGRLFHEFIRNTHFQDTVEKILLSREEIEMEMEIFDREKIYLQMKGVLLFDAAGKTKGALVVFTDISRIKKLENIRKDFVANVSHELKTPLTAIIGAVETIMENDLKTKEKRKLLEIIAGQSRRLNSLINDILELSKIEHGIKDSDMLETSILEIINSAVEVCAGDALKKNISISTDVEDIKWRIAPNLFQQVLINLIDNAVKYTDPNGYVKITGKKSSDVFSISVTDNGCGISKEHLPRIFERFYRVEKMRSRKLGGTGLGLAIVKHVINAHNGHIFVESVPAKGTTFTIELKEKPDAIPESSKC